MTTGPEPRIRTEAGFGPGGVNATGARRASATAATNRSNTASASSGPGAPSGWYWTVSIGFSRWRRPSTEPSLRLTWLTRNPDAAGSDAPDDLDLVVLGGHLDHAQLLVVDRVVRPVVPEPEARRVGPRRPPDDLVAEADAEQRPPVVDDRLRQRDRAVESSRIPGPGDRIRPSMSGASATADEIVCGRMRTRAPRWRMAWTMFDFNPKSTMPISGPPSSARPMSMIDDGETWPTKSWSSQRVHGPAPQRPPRRDPSRPVR